MIALTYLPQLISSQFQAIEMCESLRIHRSEISQQEFAANRLSLPKSLRKCMAWDFDWRFDIFLRVQNRKKPVCSLKWNKMSRIFVVRSALVFVLFLWYVRWVSGYQCHVDHLESEQSVSKTVSKRRKPVFWFYRSLMGIFSCDSWN